MVTGFNDPTVLIGLNNSFNTTTLWHAAGDTTLDAGIIAPAQSGAPAAVASVANTHTSPLMYYTHSITRRAQHLPAGHDLLLHRPEQLRRPLTIGGGAMPLPPAILACPSGQAFF